MKKLARAALLAGILLQLSAGGHAADLIEPGARSEFSSAVVHHRAASHNVPLPRKASQTAAWSAANIPEPAIWAMLILCFGVLGGAMRAARR
jgi:hypothetical protein